MHRRAWCRVAVFCFVLVFLTVHVVPRAAAEVEPPTILATGYVSGNAFPYLPTDEFKTVRVVRIEQAQPGEVIFALRNNLGKDLVDVRGSVTVRDANGMSIESTNEIEIFPSFLQSGEAGWGRAMLATDSLPANADIQVTVIGTSLETASNQTTYNFVVIDATSTDGQIVGSARNDHEDGLSAPVTSVSCFDEEGALLSVTSSSSNDNLVVAADERFEFKVSPSSPCNRFLVAVQGEGPEIDARSLAPKNGPAAAALGPEFAPPIITPAPTREPLPTPTPVDKEPLTFTETLYLQTMYEVVKLIYTGFTLLDQGGQVNIITASAQWHAALLTVLQTSVPSRMSGVSDYLFEATKNFDKAASILDDALLSGSSFASSDSFGAYVENGLMALVELDDELSRLAKETGDEIPGIT